MMTPPAVVAGVGDELQAVVQRLDVRPGEELDAQPGTDILRLGGEFGEFLGPRPRSQGPSSPSGVTLMCRAPSTSAASSRLRRTRSDSSRCGPSSHQYGIPSSSRWTIPLSASMVLIPASRYSATAAGRSSDSRPKPRKPAAAAASIRSRRGSGLRRSGRSEAASPALVQQVAISSSRPGSSRDPLRALVGTVLTLSSGTAIGGQLCGIISSTRFFADRIVGRHPARLQLQLMEVTWAGRESACR